MKAEPVMLDTGAFSLYFGGDAQIKEIMSAILKGDTEAHTCELNVAEYYYKTCERYGREIAAITSGAIRDTPILIHSPNGALTTEASQIKCTFRGKISLVDAYVLALSKVHRCRLITTDAALKDTKIVPTTLLKVP